MHSVIREEAEERFLLELQDQIFLGPDNRCMIFRLSQIKCDHEAALAKIIAVIEEISPKGHGKIFVMHDFDIMILDKTLSYTFIERFYTHLTPHLLPVQDKLNPGLASLFIVGMDRETLINIMIYKLDSLRSSNDLKPPATDNSFISNQSKPPSRQEEINALNKKRSSRTKAEIMIAEDDAFSRMLVKTVLDDEYKLDMVKDGESALQKYASIAPDVLFLDIGLPDIDGHELLGKIFTIDPGAYIIMFSGHSDVHNVTKAIEEGAKGFLSKPFTKDKLLRFIEKSPYVQEKKALSHF